MPLALLLVTRPARVVHLVLLAGLTALAAGAAALGSRPIAGVATFVALLTAGAVLGALAPLYGRAAAIGLWTARAGLALGMLSFLIPAGGVVTGVRVSAAMLVVAGLRPVARGVTRLGDLPAWPSAAVGIGIVAALLAPTLGGAIVLAGAWVAVAVTMHALHVATAASAPARA
jgi:hypothetical protein